VVAKPVLVKSLSRFWNVGKLANLTSNLIQKNKSRNIAEAKLEYVDNMRNNKQ
jgi:hypothetical protein